MASISVGAYGGEASEAAAPAPKAKAVAPAEAAAAAPSAAKQAPAPTKSAVLIDLPPVSSESIQSLLDYLGAQLVHAMDYRVSADVTKVPMPERNLERLAIYMSAETDGVILAGLMPGGKVLVVKATTQEGKLLSDLNDLVRVAQAKVQSLTAATLREVMARAKVASLNLSYIKTDKALGALKAMGYNVIEMTEVAGVAASKAYTMAAVNDFRMPLITCFIDADSSALSEAKTKQPGVLGSSVTPDIGGSSMANVTDSSAQQRLMICYDPDNAEAYQRLMNDIQTVVDIPAQQILIEGMILEVNDDRLKELGVDYKTTETQSLTYWEAPQPSSPARPFTVDAGAWSINNQGFALRLRAMVENGSADVLSKPSILALNNYQARIRIGRETPISTTVTTAATTNLNVSYFFMGIVLNIKPRIDRDQKEVSMQVEAIVSSRAPVKALTTIVNGVEVEVAPVVDSRVVQTYARVSNNTPFIIGGLISHDIRETRTGIPLLMDIPVLGLLFGKTVKKETRNEVIVVLTPRIIPLESENYFAVIPKDSEKFDTSTSQLFRNSYRIKGQDIFDLAFVRDDRQFMDLAQRAAEKTRERPQLARDPSIGSILDEKIPGETPIMIRMLYEIVKAQKTGHQIATENIILFEPRRDKNTDQETIRVKYLVNELKNVGNNSPLQKALVLHYDVAGKDPKSQLMTPLSIQVLEARKRADYDTWMKTFNKMKDDGTFESVAIVLQTPSDLERLKTCLALKKLLEINSLPPALHVKDFPVGMQILYPNMETEENRKQVIDAKVAELFYVSDYYYQVFQQIHKAELTKIDALLKVE